MRVPFGTILPLPLQIPTCVRRRRGVVYACLEPKCRLAAGTLAVVVPLFLCVHHSKKNPPGGVRPFNPEVLRNLLQQWPAASGTHCASVGCWATTVSVGKHICAKYSQQISLGKLLEVLCCLGMWTSWSYLRICNVKTASMLPNLSHRPTG